MSRRTGIVIQARVGSSRLPSKVLYDVEGLSVIGWVIARTQRVSRKDALVCAIPDTSANDALAVACEGFGVPVVRGPEHDVLARYRMCCDQYHLTDVVRITSDCPLIDPAIVDRAIHAHESGNYDLSANRVEEAGAFPRGMDVEVVRVSALRAIDALQLEPRYREHVTNYFYEHPDKFPLHYIDPEPFEARPSVRLCIDHREDLEVVRQVVRHFANRRDFSLAEIIRFLDAHPTIAALNDAHKTPSAEAASQS